MIKNKPATLDSTLTQIWTVWKYETDMHKTVEHGKHAHMSNAFQLYA